MLDFVSSSNSVRSRRTLSMHSSLPLHLQQKAFCSYGSYAWRKEDLAELFEYCLAASVAVTGGEGWIVRCLGRDESISFLPHLTGNYVVYQVVPQRSGRTAVFAWHNCWAEQTQSWQTYVADTVQRAKTIIEQAQFEANILPEYAAHVYYNLTFERQDGLCF